MNINHHQYLLTFYYLRGEWGQAPVLVLVDRVQLPGNCQVSGDHWTSNYIISWHTGVVDGMEEMAIGHGNTFLSLISTQPVKFEVMMIKEWILVDVCI